MTSPLGCCASAATSFHVPINVFFRSCDDWVAPHLIVCREVVQKMRVQQLFSVAKQPASRENNRGPYPGILSQSGVSCQGSERQRQHWYPFAQRTALPLPP